MQQGRSGRAPRGAALRAGVVAGIMLVPAVGGAARVWRIAPDGGGDAPTIQAGIDSASAGDAVVLAPGIYSWTTQGAAGASMLQLDHPIELRGEAGAATTILDAESSGRVLACTGAGAAVSIAGLTFRNGLAPPEGSTGSGRSGGARRAPDDSHGGGIDIHGVGTPVIRGCVFSNNEVIGGTARGGAICCDLATIEDCDFVANGAGVKGHTNGHGGAIACGNATLSRCRFRANRAWGFDAASGGAAEVASASIVDCVFEDNHVECPGGPVGGAVAASGAPVIARCLFRDNSAEAHYFSANGGAVDASTGSVTDCVFIGNVATCLQGPGRGGAIVGAEYTVRRCVFIDNTARRSDPPGPGLGGAIYSHFESTIENCTLVGNSGGTSAGTGGIALAFGGTVRSVLICQTTVGLACSGSATWACCDLFGNTAGNTPCGIDAGGNISADPLFCSDPRLTGDVSIQVGSPCAPTQRPGADVCGLIGAGAVNCEAQAIESRTWSQIKQLYRPASAPVGAAGGH